MRHDLRTNEFYITKDAICTNHRSTLASYSTKFIKVSIKKKKERKSSIIILGSKDYTHTHERKHITNINFLHSTWKKKK